MQGFEDRELAEGHAGLFELGRSFGDERIAGADQIDVSAERSFGFLATFVVSWHIVSA